MPISIAGSDSIPAKRLPMRCASTNIGRCNSTPAQMKAAPIQNRALRNDVAAGAGAVRSVMDDASPHGRANKRKMVTPTGIEPVFQP